MGDLVLKPLPPKDALEAFRGRKLELTESWQDLWHEEHARAFTVAHVSSLDLLQSIHEELGKALEAGLSKDQFKTAMVGRLQAEGWLGEASRDAEGAARLGRPGRLDLIYDANLRTAHAAGQWGRIERMKQRFPFLRYSTQNDARVRPQHRAWEGITLPVDDPFWDTHMPPNGWRCRCTVSQWSQADLDAAGFTVTPPEHLPPDELVLYVNKRTGEVTQVPRGIDPGWAYNPGKAGARTTSLLQATVQKLEGYASTFAQKGIEELVQGEAFEAWLAKPEGHFPVLRLPEDLQSAIHAERAVAVLSPETLVKQAKSHPELGLGDYRVLARMNQPDLVLQDGENTLVLVRVEDQLWYAAVKAARSGEKETFVTSFRRTSVADIDRKLRKGQVLLDSGRWRG